MGLGWAITVLLSIYSCWHRGGGPKLGGPAAVRARGGLELGCGSLGWGGARRGGGGVVDDPVLEAGEAGTGENGGGTGRRGMGGTPGGSGIRCAGASREASGPRGEFGALPRRRQ